MNLRNGWTWTCVVLLLLATAPACGSSNDVDTPCGALAACCTALSAGEAQECQTATSSSTVTQAECAEALEGYQAGGFCQGITSGDGGTSETGSPFSVDAGSGPDPAAELCDEAGPWRPCDDAVEVE
jgi:hypothetical protein